MATTTRLISLVMLCHLAWAREENVFVLGSEEGGAFGAGASEVVEGEFEEGLRGWKDLPGACFVEVPLWIVGVKSMVPAHRLCGESLVEYHCPKDAVEACDAFVFLYKCGGCESEKGGLVGKLVEDGWSVASCGMKFKTGVEGGTKHKMMTLRKQHAPGTSVWFFVRGNVEYIAFGRNTNGVDCSTRKTIETCDEAAEAHHGGCAWDYTADTCAHTNYCPRIRGPNWVGSPGTKSKQSGCDVCVRDEVPAVAGDGDGDDERENGRNEGEPE